MFGSGEDRASALSSAIINRPQNQDTLDAIELFILLHGPYEPGASTSELFTLIRTTPALSEYARLRWIECQEALSDALEVAGGFGSGAGVQALARFILESPQVAGAQENPRKALHEIFSHLRRGWSDGNL